MAKPTRKKTEPRPIVPVEPKGYDVKRIAQMIRSEDLFEPLSLDPKYVPLWYTDNFIQRVLARIVAQGPTEPVVIRATKEGALSVVQRGGAFDDYERLEQTFAISGAERTTSGAAAGHLIDAGEDFPAQGIKIGDTVKNVTDTTYAYVTAVAVGDLTLSSDIMAAAELYRLIPCIDFTFTQQVERIDLFTYEGNVDYQLSRDLVKALGAKIELFTDSFYSLDFYTRRVRATVPTWTDATPQRVKLMGWFRAEG